MSVLRVDSHLSQGVVTKNTPTQYDFYNGCSNFHLNFYVCNVFTVILYV